MKRTHKLGAAAAALATGVSAVTVPTAVAGTHTVTYSVWVDVPAPNGFSVGYATGDGPDQTGDPNLSLAPGEVWTHEVTMDNPTQWAYLDVVYHGAPANPRGTHCEIKVDGAVRSSGASICSIQPLRAGFGPPGTM